MFSLYAKLKLLDMHVFINFGKAESIIKCPFCYESIHKNNSIAICVYPSEFFVTSCWVTTGNTTHWWDYVILRYTVCLAFKKGDKVIDKTRHCDGTVYDMFKFEMFYKQFSPRYTRCLNGFVPVFLTLDL